MPRGRNAALSESPTRVSGSKKYKVQGSLREQSDDSFESPESDPNLTDYIESHSSRLAGNRTHIPMSLRKTRSPQRNSPPNPRTSGRRTRSNALVEPSYSEEGPSTSHQQQSPKKSVGSARRKAKKPKRKMRALKDIRLLQKTTNLLIPRLPFGRVIREILQMLTFDGMRVTPTALQALQEASEIYLTTLFADSYRCTLHRERVTLQVKDMELARYLRGRSDPGNY